VIDLSSPGAVRLDPSGFEALVDAARHGSAGAPPQAKEALADERLDGVMSVMLDPAAVLRLVVAGPDTRLEHRGWLADGVLVLLLGVRTDLLQLMKTPPAFLPATLVRLTRMRPRHLPERVPVEFAAARLDELVSPDARLRAPALAEVNADFAWRLDFWWDGGGRSLTAVDGDLGLRFAYPDVGRLVPVTNTFGYRVLSTVMAST
jgi:hypothetical protein